jgi:hypothetical protein
MTHPVNHIPVLAVTGETKSHQVFKEFFHTSSSSLFDNSGSPACAGFAHQEGSGILRASRERITILAFWTLEGVLPRVF